MRVGVKLSVAAGMCLMGFALTTPYASADPGVGTVAVQCQVYSQGMGPGGFSGFGGGMPGGFGIPSWAGSVTGHGANFGEARADAERQKWGPYGMAPELRDCVQVSA